MRALYTSATGLMAQQTRIDNIANNLANVSTTGFKKSREVFEDLMSEQMAVGDPNEETRRPSNLEVGTGTRIVSTTRSFTQGSLQHTGNTFDLAVDGKGFFVIEREDGEQYYTRDGHFEVNSDGELVTSAGYRVSPGIQIPDDAAVVEIAEDGSVSASFEGGTDIVSLGVIEVVTFVNPAGLRAEGGNLYSQSPESGEPMIVEPEDGTRIRQGVLESSNVDVAEELVTMITAQRAYELNSKAIETADELLRIAVNLKK